MRFGRIAIIYGARSPEHFAFVDEFDHWRSLDVKLDLTVTQPRGSWGGAIGRVQDHLGEAVRHTLDVTAFVCGSETMMAETTDTLVALGIPREQVLRNY
jgi:NAD(P)H-flavin reductase